MFRSTHLAALAAVLALGGLTTACGGDATASGTVPTTAAHDTQDAHDMGDGIGDGTTGMPDVVIEGVNYEFHDVPDTVPAGTRLGFRNGATDEVHEMVVFHVADGNDTPLAELVNLPEDELGPLLGEPVTVMLQAPGGDVMMPVGDGVLAEPGRYVMMCFIPIGADPTEFMTAVAAAQGGPPADVAGGPPHFTGGMYAELIVE